MVDHPADQALSRINTIIASFAQFLKDKGEASETDTRVKFIDRVLKEVCLWPESDISREDSPPN
jgi:hypothetical protein